MLPEAVTVEALVIVKLDKGVPPTVLLKLIAPEPAVMVNACGPMSVFPNVMAALFVRKVLIPVIAVGWEKFRGFAPVTVTFPPTRIKLALVKVRFVGTTAFPTAPPNVTTPVPARNVGAVAPFRFAEKVISALVVLKVGALAITVFPVHVIAPPLVVMLPFTLMVDAV